MHVVVQPVVQLVLLLIVLATSILLLVTEINMYIGYISYTRTAMILW